MKFKVGDRVRAYGYDSDEGLWTGDKGTVTEVESGGYRMLTVKADNPLDGDVQFHPKQCRKLKKKERRRVWLNADHVDAMFEGGCTTKVNASPHSTREGQRWSEFIEVCK